MNLNISKCKILSVGHNVKNFKKFDYTLNLPTVEHSVPSIEHVDSMNDLGIVIDSKLHFTQHIQEKVNKAYQLLGIIRRNFALISKDVFLLLYKVLVRSQLEYGSVVYYPHSKGLIFELEKVQKRATKLIHEYKDLSYKERLRKLKLPTLKYRRARGDMIQVYKIVHGIYDISLAPSLEINVDNRTRGNCFKLKHQYSRYDLRKFSFGCRIVPLWNNLPDVVVCSPSLNSFKNNLDIFWANQEFLYDWEAPVPGIDN